MTRSRNVALWALAFAAQAAPAAAQRRYTVRHEYRTAREVVYDWQNGVTNVFTGDFNGDGKWDIGVTGTRAEGERCWYIRYGDGNGGFGGAGREPVYCWKNTVTNVFTGDFDGDGIWDIGVTGTREEGDRTWTIRYGDGKGGFGRQTTYYWGNGVTNVFTGDFDGDGKWDIGVTGRRDENDRTWYIRYGDGKGGFGRQTNSYWGNGVTNVFTGDFDGDGKWDIGVTGTRAEGDRRWYIRLGNGRGQFGGPGRDPVYGWGNGVTNIFTGDFDGNGGWDIGVTGTRDERYGKWHIRLNARSGVAPRVPPPQVTRIRYPDRAMNGELVRVTVDAQSHATRVAIGGARAAEMTRSGSVWVADIVASQGATYTVTAFAGNRAGQLQTFSFNMFPDFAPLSCPAYTGLPNLLWNGAGPVPDNLVRWNPKPAKENACRYVQTYGEGAEGGVATPPGSCCRFAAKLEGHDVPIRNARVRLFRWFGPVVAEWGSPAKFYTDDTGFIDLGAFLTAATGYSVDIYSEYTALKLVNGLKNGAVYKQTIDNVSRNDRVRTINGEQWAYAYGNRLMAQSDVMKRMLGDEWTKATGPGTITANWDHVLPVTSTGFPFPNGAEVILKPTSRDESLYPSRYLLWDGTVREELAHVVHFRAIGRAPELLGRYGMFILEALTRAQVIALLKLDENAEAIRFFDTAPGREKPPSDAATRVRNRAVYPETRGWVDLPFSTRGTHMHNLLTSEVTAYVEAFGTIAARGVFDDGAQGSLLEGIRASLVERECPTSACNASALSPAVGRLDTLMSADKVVKSEGHLTVLMFLDFPRLAGISVGQVFGIMKRSKAISFREFARYVQSNESSHWEPLRRAAARQNIVLERLVDRMGSN